MNRRRRSSDIDRGPGHDGLVARAPPTPIVVVLRGAALRGRISGRQKLMEPGGRDKHAATRVATRGTVRRVDQTLVFTFRTIENQQFLLGSTSDGHRSSRDTGESGNGHSQRPTCYSRRMKWREILPSALKPDNVDPKVAHETLLQIIAERKAREERRKSKSVKSGHTRQAKR